jgi:hypothetical protein
MPKFICRGSKVKTSGKVRPSHLRRKEGIAVDYSPRHNHVGVYAQWLSESVPCILYFKPEDLVLLEAPIKLCKAVHNKPLGQYITMGACSTS